MKEITIYTKWCIKCVRPEGFALVKAWCNANNYGLVIKRTAYRPKLHKEASIYWGDEHYQMFIRDENTGVSIDFDEFTTRIVDNVDPLTQESTFKEKTKKKPVKGGKKKVTKHGTE